MNTLNPKLFHEGNDGTYIINEGIIDNLNTITQSFTNYLSEQGVELSIADVRIVGSNAGFDYTDKSDIDLHIVADFEATSCDTATLQILLNSERRSFNTTYTPSVKGIPVELYVEDIKAGTESNGIYSILQNRWIKYPVREYDNQIDTNKYNDNVNQFINIIVKTIATRDLQQIQHLLNRIYMMRKNGIEAGGRNSGGNVVFKQLRNLGYIKQLQSARDELISNQLTFESLSRRSNNGYKSQKI